jgi:hypothetical protein
MNKCVQDFSGIVQNWISMWKNFATIFIEPDNLDLVIENFLNIWKLFFAMFTDCLLV